jgi:hypothetical protein
VRNHLQVVALFAVIECVALLASNHPLERLPTALVILAMVAAYPLFWLLLLRAMRPALERLVAQEKAKGNTSFFQRPIDIMDREIAQWKALSRFLPRRFRRRSSEEEAPQ